MGSSSKQSVRSEIEVPPRSRPFSAESKAPDNLTEAQRARDSNTTTLYSQYVKAHEDKSSFIVAAKDIILCWSMTVISIVLGMCTIAAFYTVVCAEKSLDSVLTIVAALTPLVIAVIGILGTVTKHVFPDNDEQHIANIVKVILESDIKHKEMNIIGKKDSE